MAAQTINAVDVHVAGEAGRVLLESHLWVKGEDMSARLEYCRKHLTWLRELMLKEPRGYPGLLGALVLPPVNMDSDFSIIILEQADFAPMSGANLMCAVTALIETGSLEVSEPLTTLRVDTASGRVEVRAAVSGGRVVDVAVENVPSFVVVRDHVLTLPEYGDVSVDIAFGGQYYVQAAAESFGLELHSENGKDIIRAANSLLAVARREMTVAHPTQTGLNRIHLPMLHGPGDEPGVDSKSVVVMPHGEPSAQDPDSWIGGTLDRSPGGTGTSARMAVKHAAGELLLEQDFVNQSILGTTFTGRLRGTEQIGEFDAVLPTICGRGWITGFHQFVLRNDDPFPVGYTLGDIWGK